MHLVLDDDVTQSMEDNDDDDFLYKQVHNAYQARRWEQRDLALAFLKQRTRRNTRFPWEEAVPLGREIGRIDSHGRLIRQSSNDDDELVDAATPLVRPAIGPQQQPSVEQMEQEAKEAIERGISRYSRFDDANEAVYELIPIAIRSPQREDPIHNNDIHNNERMMDVRLAFRRICFATVTVVAAFLCTVVQDIPYYHYDQDGVDVRIDSYASLESHDVPMSASSFHDFQRRLFQEGDLFRSEEETFRIHTLLNDGFDTIKETIQNTVDAEEPPLDDSRSCDVLH